MIMSAVISQNLQAKKIQNFYKIYKLNQNIKNHRSQELHAIASSIPFHEFTQLMRKKELMHNIDAFIKNVSSKTNIEINVSPRIVLSGYLINYYADKILDEEKNRHPIDVGILEWSTELTRLLELEEYKTVSQYKKLALYIVNYNQIFNQWKTMDKSRTIERIIVSYHNRCEHIETINKDENMDNDQKEKCLKELENQKNELIFSIKRIDPKFNIEYLQQNYKKIYDELKNSWEKVFKQTGNAMKKAYYDMLQQEIKNGSLKPVHDLFVEICQRILIITPEKRKESLAKKLNPNTINEIVLENDWNEELLKFIGMLADIILMFGAPADDEENKKWRESLKYIEKYEYAVKLPEVLIGMEEKLDRIYQLIIQNTKDNKSK